MGKLLMGGTEHTGNVGLLTPEQQSYLSKAMGATSQMGQPLGPEQFGEMFQKSYVDPMTQILQRQIIPMIKEQALGPDEMGSSALNQALAQSATDLSTALGSQYMSQYGQEQNRILQALGALGGLSGQKTFEPMIQQTQGILGPLLGALGQLGGAYLGVGG